MEVDDVLLILVCVPLVRFDVRLAKAEPVIAMPSKGKASRAVTKTEGNRQR